LGWALCAVALEEDAPMVIESEIDSAYGVQFHPESVLTPQGLRMIKNWLALVN
jgi:anthranilate/para-aminobenzoate synthase component II